MGGGNILVTRVNGMAVEITGQYTTLIVLHRDAPGTIAAVTEEMSRRGVNICNFRLSRAQKGGTAVMTIEVDGALEPDVNSCVEKLPNVLSSTMLAPMYRGRMRMDLRYDSIAALIEAAKQSGRKLSELVLEQQAVQMEQSADELYEIMRKSYAVMAASVEEGKAPGVRSASGLSGGDAYRMARAEREGNVLCGGVFSGALTRALAVSEWNAAMGRIVAAPTAGSCGILPAAVLTLQAERKLPERACVMSLFTASAVGMVIANNACIAGAQGGCQAECGSAAAMAAAALVELCGGAPDMLGDAVSISLGNVLGLVCDPVAGLVEIPCIHRNAAGVAGALVAAQLALAGIRSPIPADEAILAMKRVGDAMPTALKETAEGGLAATPAGKRLYEQVFGKNEEGDASPACPQGCSACRM